MAELNKVKLKQAAPKITDPGNSTKSAIQKGKSISFFKDGEYHI